MSEYTCGETQDTYTPDLGETEGPIQCGVCGATMEVKRKLYGPKSSIMAMGGSKRWHDLFSCPYREEDWHRQVKRLREAARETPSGRLARMFREEADEVIRSRRGT